MTCAACLELCPTPRKLTVTYPLCPPTAPTLHESDSRNHKTSSIIGTGTSRVSRHHVCQPSRCRLSCRPHGLEPTKVIRNPAQKRIRCHRAAKSRMHALSRLQVDWARGGPHHRHESISLLCEAILTDHGQKSAPKTTPPSLCPQNGTPPRLTPSDTATRSLRWSTS